MQPGLCLVEVEMHHDRTGVCFRHGGPVCCSARDRPRKTCAAHPYPGRLVTLERKTLSIMAATLLVSLVVSYAIGQYVLWHGFAQVEEDDARRHLQRAQAVLHDKVNEVDHLLADWAGWDDTYSFMETLDPDYVKSNLVIETFVNTGLHVCIYTNAQGQVIWARQVDRQREREVPICPFLLAELAARPLLTGHRTADDVVKGVLLTDEGPLLIASRPIIRSDKTGPIRGSLVMGRHLDAERIDAMSRVLLTRPAIYWDGQPGLSAPLRADFQTLKEGPGVRIDRLDENALSCRSLIADVYGRPALLIQMTLPREIHRRGQVTVQALLVAMCAGAIVFIVMTLRMLNRQIVCRVMALDRAAREIARSRDASQRVPVSGCDELTNLAASFNSMLGELQQTNQNLRQARDVAQAASLTKSRFLTNVSHEIRTPLNCIIGFAEMICRGERAEELHQHARTILHESEVLLALINDLLDNAKIEAGRLQLEHRPFNLHQLLEEVTRLARVQAQGKPVEVSLRIGEVVPANVVGDSLRLRQVLVNLLSNAVKFTERGSVKLHAELAEASLTTPTLRFEVVDTGIGIPADRHEAIFESFSQVDPSTTRKYGGTGLGTTIARQLVALMGGRIGLESEPGRGSTFRFTIPVSLDGATHETAAQPAEVPTVPPGRILLAEDYEPSRRMIAFVLENAGHAVTAVETGVALLAAYRRDRYDLVITDIQMPEMDGYQAAQAIRQEGSWPQVPIIALTADSDHGTWQRCLESGINEVLIKPAQRDKLLPTVARWLAAGDVAGPDVGPSEARLQPDATPDATTNATTPWDRGTAVREFGNAELVDDVAARFLDTVAQQIGRMRVALEQHQTQVLRREAHTIKGGAGTLAAGPLAAAAGELERLGTDQDATPHDWEQALRMLEVAFEDLRTVVDSARPGTPMMEESACEESGRR